ncbi:MAG TPA: hypothetical protein VGN23_16660 [Verrucomicrobiae bacterium]
MSLQLPFAVQCARLFSLGILLVLATTVSAQTNYYATNGTEYAITGSLPGDNVFPDAALNSQGGFLVWQDNAVDGSGWGVSAMRVDSTLSGTLSPFRVNVTGTNDQENARVALLKGGGAVFVWQGGVEGYQHVYARFLSSTNTFLTTTDVLVSTFTNAIGFQANPAVAVLNNSNVVVVWGSYDQADSNSLQDVYGQILSPKGQAIGTNFLINQFTTYNQRTPAVAALAGGGFAVAWVSEQERAVALANSTATLSGQQITGTASSTTIVTGQEVYPSVDIYARLYNSNAVAATNEFLVDAGSNPCADPDIAAGSDGGFMIAWCAHDMLDVTNGWDIFACPFSAAGVAGAVSHVNSYTYGDQYAPRLTVLGTSYLAVWTSLAQDGSLQGVFGQFLTSSAAPVGNEFQVNTTWMGRQMQPTIASDGLGQFLAVWTSSEGLSGANPNPNFNLYAQRYVNVADVLITMSAPNVWAPFTLSNNVYQPQLVVSWSPLQLQGISVSNFEVYVDGATSPMGVTASNCWVMTSANGLSTNSTHSFTVDYVTAAGGHSPQSSSTSGATWSGLNWGGIPYEWMAEYFGGYNPATHKYTTTFWPSATQSMAPNLTLLGIFMTGGNPLDSTTWLVSNVANTSQGIFLSWNTQPGLTYQVQASTNLNSWANFGAQRYAAGTNDSINIGTNAAAYYRIQWVNQ